MTTTRETIFGTDLNVSEQAPGYDLTRSNTGDLKLAQGNENIIQALIMRLSVRHGELALLGWPNYGSRLHELIGEANNRRTHLRLMAYARAAIEQDPRVQEVKEVRTLVIPGERDVVEIRMDILLINEQTPLNLVYIMNLEAL